MHQGCYQTQKTGNVHKTSDLQFWRELAGTDLAKIAIETERTGTPLATFPSVKTLQWDNALLHLYLSDKAVKVVTSSFVRGIQFTTHLQTVVRRDKSEVTLVDKVREANSLIPVLLL